ncbi:hypothetical protein EMCRGX_G031741 [Ephydatia muelleri]
MNPNVRVMEYAVRGKVPLEAMKIKQELEQASGSTKYPFKKVLFANIGDCHAMGQKPITFVRQVLAAGVLPELMSKALFPSDVTERARAVLQSASGHSLGSYTDSRGLHVVRKHVAEFLEKRDGFPADMDCIYLINGASEGIKQIMKLAIQCDRKVGFLLPIPQYPLYTACIAENNADVVPYYLDEDNNWAISVDTLRKSIAEGRKHCEPSMMICINPGNPTGQLLNEENMKQIIQFCHKEQLVLLADEVYQENVYKEGAKFVSFKKVLRSMGPEYDKFQLVSFNSISKGYLGECGLRGGYMELIGFDSAMMGQIYKMSSAMLCSTSVGQTVTDVLVNPPRPGEPSYKTFQEERGSVLSALRRKAKLVTEGFNAVPGVHCNEVQGAMYAFPKINIPAAAQADAEANNMQLDEYYCLMFLRETGVCVVPGSGFRQIPGTWHFRTTILPPEEDIKLLLQRFAQFHTNFVQRYSR